MGEETPVTQEPDTGGGTETSGTQTGDAAPADAGTEAPLNAEGEQTEAEQQTGTEPETDQGA